MPPAEVHGGVGGGPPSTPNAITPREVVSSTVLLSPAFRSATIASSIATALRADAANVVSIAGPK